MRSLQPTSAMASPVGPALIIAGVVLVNLFSSPYAERLECVIQNRDSAVNIH